MKSLKRTRTGINTGTSAQQQQQNLQTKALAVSKTKGETRFIPNKNITNDPRSIAKLLAYRLLGMGQQRH